MESETEKIEIIDLTDFESKVFDALPVGPMRALPLHSIAFKVYGYDPRNRRGQHAHVSAAIRRLWKKDLAYWRVDQISRSYSVTKYYRRMPKR